MFTIFQQSVLRAFIVQFQNVISNDVKERIEDRLLSTVNVSEVEFEDITFQSSDITELTVHWSAITPEDDNEEAISQIILSVLSGT